MRRWSGAAVALAALAIACDPQPEDPFYFRGTALDAAGHPLAGAKLQLSSILLGMIDPHGLGLKPRGEITVAADGSFIHEVPYSLLSDFEGHYAYFRLEGTPAEDGSAAVLDFTYSGRSDITLPPLRPAPLALTHAEDALHVEPPPSSNEKGPFHLVELLQGEQLAWRARVTSADVALDPALREDFADVRARMRLVEMGTVEVQSLLLERWASADYMVDTRSAPLELARGTLVPVSRGASCGVGEGGRCPFTDGLLDWVELPAEMKELVLTLPAAHVPKRLILRGVDPWFSPLAVEGSNDGGATWTALGTVTSTWNGLPQQTIGWGPVSFLAHDAFESVALEGTHPVSLVRLRATDAEYGGRLPLSLREVSVFE